MNSIISYNPAKNFEILGEVSITSNEKISQKVTLAKKANISWGRMPIKE